ncbi:N-formylglutamate amidohydrolase [Dichotomicrobium thermohalophilum]|uniref:Putative N-formylglutamate amidohydrolase n=1 Tax=Dichotomicrobium thermohalophilum TaxID=933063 RepID=A0A397PGM2_9HYPH|nr:N-formylglutamate amidohydrolase [Dichotomicrobium thermohalophilum]RIA47633.1 putative N-formylglutamate amidohydrolase [Dichotomicrobium thermohalophilum]
MVLDGSNLNPLLTPSDGPPVMVENQTGKGDVLLVCEHASAALPEALGDLGLSPRALESHVAWDPGALAVARTMAKDLDAALVAARFSRLAYDCNRSPERADAITAKSERFEVPGNAGISDQERERRAAAIFQPFRDTLVAMIETKAPRALVSVHTFTPVYHGQRREVELGVLHDADSRLADALLARATQVTGLRSERNAPYGPADGVTHTLRSHALPRGLPNVMLEIRSDLVADAHSQDRVGRDLAALVRAGLDALDEED